MPNSGKFDIEPVHHHLEFKIHTSEETGNYSQLRKYFAYLSILLNYCLGQSLVVTGSEGLRNEAKVKVVENYLTVEGSEKGVIIYKSVQQTPLSGQKSNLK
ncbi:MAG: hypothetical protein AB4058_11005 [Microcystaceae cyanobacterium]